MVPSPLTERRAESQVCANPKTPTPTLPPPPPTLSLTPNQSASAPALRRNSTCNSGLSPLSVHGGTYFGGAEARSASSGPRRPLRASRDSLPWGAEARAAASAAASAGAQAGAAKRVTFTGVARLSELRRGHKQQRSSQAQVRSDCIHLVTRTRPF